MIRDSATKSIGSSNQSRSQETLRQGVIELLRKTSERFKLQLRHLLGTKFSIVQDLVLWLNMIQDFRFGTVSSSSQSLKARRQVLKDLSVDSLKQIEVLLHNYPHIDLNKYCMLYTRNKIYEIQEKGPQPPHIFKMELPWDIPRTAKKEAKQESSAQIDTLQPSKKELRLAERQRTLERIEQGLLFDSLFQKIPVKKREEQRYKPTCKQKGLGEYRVKEMIFHPEISVSFPSKDRTVSSPRNKMSEKIQTQESLGEIQGRKDGMQETQQHTPCKKEQQGNIGESKCQL